MRKSVKTWLVIQIFGKSASGCSLYNGDMSVIVMGNANLDVKLGVLEGFLLSVGHWEVEEMYG